ncbi:tyrosine-type recombinase/integrase [Micromonospora sp. Llam7]|uniref:tyrosine-type recombinase/integrase n=1 Tax=Micromonospora tarapacensis TaxID=2835305 RepID=UPI001C829C3B|nr:tyrosine-type recombinase/integrase [Micromonospora tarapacensis]
MRAAAAKPTSGSTLAKLMAVVRTEFRAEVYVPAPNDPVFVADQCIVADCDRTAETLAQRLCGAHSQRFRKRGYSSMEEFLADPGPPTRGRKALAACVMTGCRHGRWDRNGLCRKHNGYWKRAGQPDLAVWDAPDLACSGPTPAECKLPFCDLWVDSLAKSFCPGHYDRWARHGRPDLERFVTDCELVGTAHIDLRALAPQPRLEIQYALQCRHDARGRVAPARMVTPAVRLVATLGITSLLEMSEQQWRAAAATRPNQSLIFLLDARYGIEALRDGIGWETEYSRDVWRLDRLPGIAGPGGRPCPRVRLRFDRITHPRLRELGKRWTRLRLTSGLSIGAARAGVDALTRFSDFLALAGVGSLADINRPLLERYLAHAMSQLGGNDAKRHRISALNVFFQAVRQHGWDDSLPGRATFYPGDTPPIRAQVDRRLAEFVMAQVESPANLARWSDLSAKLVTLILTRCGLRISSALSLAFDCVVHDGQGAPYLRYFNTKMKREAAVPIDEELEAAIGEQQRAVLRRWPDRPPLLFPRERSNVSGNVPLDPGTYRRKLNGWLQACDIRDEHGCPVHLTPHQWRHTFACRLINRDVPQEVVRVLLDHESHRMTSHYAKLTDQTVRRHWQEATKVNIKGDRVSIDPDGPLAQAQWAKTRYGMATQTLPNGYCGLPLQKSCPHANACLTCPVFLTGPEFLPELREQRHRTLTLIDVSTSNGQTRVVEMNKQVLTNLDRMIGELDTGTEANVAG